MTKLRAALSGALVFLSLHAAAQTDSTVNAITQTRDGYLWLATPRGLERFDGWNFVRVAVGETPVGAIAEDASGTLWIGSESNGLYRYRRTETRHVAGTGREIYAIAEDAMHTIWAASEDGVTRLDEHDARPLATGAGAPSTAVRAIAAAADTVWFGTADGLVRYAGGNFMTMWTSSITALAVDRDGKLWIGSEHGGVDVYANGEFTKPEAAAPLALSTIVALAADREGDIWISSEDKGLCRLRGERLDCDPVKDVVRTIYEDREGTIWLGTTNNGLRHLSAGVFILPRENDQPHVVLRDRDGSVWTGSPAGLEHNGRRYTVYDGLATTWVRALAQDRDGSIWIGTVHGVSRYANGKITTIPSDSDADVRALLIDRTDKLWIGTTSGLRCVENGRVVRCGGEAIASRVIFALEEAPDGTIDAGPLADGAVFAIVRDDGGEPWYGTNKGIFRGTSLVMPVPADGDVQPAAWRSDDGELCFATTRGIVAIDPKRAGTNRVPPPVAIESAAVHESGAEVRYAALSFVEPAKVRYRTMLEGFDRGWSDAGSARVAKYDDLPPGSYVFRVIAANNDGVWNTRGASTALRIAPPFWRTWWFAGLLVVAIGGVAIIAAFVRHENARLSQLATIDPLTGLANRRSLDEALQRRWSAVILCDIDHFKIYNDTFGHQAGDRTLARVAQAIRSTVRPGDLAARYGGEEFIVLLARASADDAARTAERIVEAVRALGIPHRDGIVTLSAGVAAGGSDNLVREADEALYRAKAEGRDRCIMAGAR